MYRISALLLIGAMWLAVLVGPLLEAWSWGPAAFALGLGLLAVAVCRSGGAEWGGWWLPAVGVATVGWFGLRAWMSPVAEAGRADLLLLGMAVGAFAVAGSVRRDSFSVRMLVWGVASLAFANGLLCGVQLFRPEFAPGFVGRFLQPSGLFGHYNEAANFLLGSGGVVAGFALLGSRFRWFERIVWAVTALTAYGAVFATGSRGGQLGAVVAVGALYCGVLIVGKRTRAKWLPMAAIGLPVLVVGLVVALVFGWAASQERRGSGTGFDVVLDNASRLQLAGIAVSCVADHPLMGGGSRSFSWECNRHWEPATHGPGTHRPEQVHNELLQAACDYGLAGAGLLVLFLSSLVVTGVLRSLDRDVGPINMEDAFWLGGVGGLSGMFVQGNFSFVFHLAPGILLLGVCLAGALRGRPGPEGKGTKWVVLPRMVCGMGIAAVLLWVGWAGTRTVAARWGGVFSRQNDESNDQALARLNRAIGVWPTAAFHLERAAILYRRGGEGDPGARDMALADFLRASEINPFDPFPRTNVAVILQEMGRYDEAESVMDVAIRLQGGMEAAYRAVFLKASYCVMRGDNALAQGTADAATEWYAKGRGVLLTAYEFPSGSPLGEDARNLRMIIAVKLGRLLGLAGRDSEAEAELEEGAAVRGGHPLRYYLAYHQYNRGLQLWAARKPSEALSCFNRAHYENRRAGPNPPAGVTPEEREELRENIEKQIRFLRGAKIEPSEPPPQ